MLARLFAQMRGEISAVRIGPNSGRIRRSRYQGVVLTRPQFHSMSGKPFSPLTAGRPVGRAASLLRGRRLVNMVVRRTGCRLSRDGYGGGDEAPDRCPHGAHDEDCPLRHSESSPPFILIIKSLTC